MNITMLEEIIEYLNIRIQKTENILNDLKEAKEIIRKRIVLLLRESGENLP